MKEKMWQNKEWLKEQYKKYGSSTIAKMCNIDDSTIIYWLRKFNIKIRTRSESLKMTESRVHNVNINYFQYIDSPQKAYWLGFLMADGTILERNNEIYYTALELAVKDIDVIKQFSNDIEYGDFSIDNKRARCLIGNTRFTYNLLNLGMRPRKTGHEVFPNLPDYLNRYFILGYFDGDGCIQYRELPKRKRARFHIVCANKEFLEKIKNVLEKNASVKFSNCSLHRKYVGSNVYELEISSFPNIAKIYDYLYTNCESYFLKRKYEIFKKIMNHYITMPRLIKRYSPICLEINRAK